MLKANYLVIPVDNAIATFWKAKFPDLNDLFDGDNLFITIEPNSYVPTWENTSDVQQGLRTRFISLSDHRQEGFDVNLATECNCASVYYLLSDLERLSKEAPCGSYTGITVQDYVLPDVADIKANNEFSDRLCLLEVETTGGTMSQGQNRSIFGTRLIFQILDK